MTQDGGVVQRSSPVAVHLVDLGSVLQEELAGCQGVLSKIGPGNAFNKLYSWSLYIPAHD